jgi:hypothetical protein
MERALATTDTKTLAIFFVLSAAGVVYIISSGLLLLEMTNVILFIFTALILITVSCGKALLSAKKVIVTNSHVVIQSQLFPFKKVALPLDDLMVVKTGGLSFFGHTTIRFAASASGDEVETNKQLAQSISDVRDTIESSSDSRASLKYTSSHQKEAVQQLIETYKTLTIRTQVSFVSNTEAQQAVQFLGQYVQHNMRQD